MKRRRAMRSALLGCVLIAAVGILLFIYDRGPMYHGRSLTYWIALYRNGPDWRAIRHASAKNGRVDGPLSAETIEARDAIRQIGTNAVPHLLRWIEYIPPAWKYKWWVSINNRFSDPDAPDGSVADWLVKSKAESRAFDAVLAFQILGQDARSAIPELRQMLMQTNNLDLSSRALNALVGIESDASSLLLTVLANTNAPEPMRQEAAHWIGYPAAGGTNAGDHVPVLVECLKDPNSFIAHEAAAGLGRIALKPEMCVPALVGCLTNSFVRYPAMRSLARFGKDARPALPALENALSDRDPFFRAAAARAIRDITAGEPEAQQW